MRYRNIVLDKANILDSKLKNLEAIVNRNQPVSEYVKTIGEAKEILQEIQDFIEREERTPGEINKF